MVWPEIVPMIYRVVLAFVGAFAVAIVSPCAAQTVGGSDSNASAAQTSGTSQETPAPNTENIAPSSRTPPSAAAPAPAPAASASSISSTSAEASPELVKKARSEGFKPKVQKSGKTLFCRKDAAMNTRFETETCYTASQIESIVEQRQQMHDELARPRACAGAACGGN